MRRQIRFLFSALLVSASVAIDQRPANTIDVSATFSELHANAPVGGCECFWMVGGTGELALPVWRNFSAVMEAGGQHTDHIPGFNVGLSLVSGMEVCGCGYRIAQSFNHTARPSSAASTALTATSRTVSENYPRAMTLRSRWPSVGGLDLAVSRHIWNPSDTSRLPLLRAAQSARESTKPNATFSRHRLSAVKL